jgi:16S rRNA (guanine527-N7)-methyltransferase
MSAGTPGPQGWAEDVCAAELSETARAGLETFIELVARYDRALDLVGPGSRGASLREHALDALAALPLLPTEGRVVDVGSGNGLPIVPLLLARPLLEGVLLEPRERRWAFLKEIVRELGLTADVRRERVEVHRGSEYDAMTVRALAPRVWGGAAARLVKVGGVVAWWCGADTVAPALTRFGPVVTSPLPLPGRGSIAVWARCFT